MNDSNIFIIKHVNKDNKYWYKKMFKKMLNFDSKKNIEVILNSRILKIFDNKELIFKELYDISLKNNINKLNLKNIVIEYKYINNLTLILEQCPILFHLDLSSNYLGDYGIDKISRVLKQYSLIIYLDLSENGIWYDGAESLSEVIKQYTFIEYLNLSTNYLCDDGILIILQVISPTIIYMNFSLNWIGNKGIENLANHIVQYNALESLNLSMNIIKAEGAQILSQVLGKCNSLIHLDLGFNYLGNIGAESIANVLGQCYSLKSLYLNCNQIGDQGSKSIAKNL